MIQQQIFPSNFFISTTNISTKIIKINQYKCSTPCVLQKSFFFFLQNKKCVPSPMQLKCESINAHHKQISPPPPRQRRVTMQFSLTVFWTSDSMAHSQYHHHFQLRRIVRIEFIISFFIFFSPSHSPIL